MEDRIGEERRGFEYILEDMNPERILIAAEAVGLGKLTPSRATEYAKMRVAVQSPDREESSHPAFARHELD